MNPIELWQSFIRINTCQPEGNEKRLVTFIRSLLPPGLESTVLEHGGTRESLIVKLPGRTDKGGIAFLGHLDTVPVGARSAWKHDPFTADTEGGYIYGRGSTDMKGGDTAMLLTALRLAEEGTPEKPVFFVFTADEESTGMGVRAAADCGLLRDIEEFIVCEPTNLKLGLGEKGALWLRFLVDGVQSHGSRPEVGRNAAEKVTELCLALKQFAEDGVDTALYGCTTASVTGLRSGVATNVIPPHAEADMDIRTIPGRENREILEKAEALCRDASRDGFVCRVEVINERSSCGSTSDAPLTVLMKEVMADIGLPQTEIGLYFYTDAAQLEEKVPVPFLILGPGDDKYAHVAEEHAPLTDLDKAVQLYYGYVRRRYYR